MLKPLLSSFQPLYKRAIQDAYYLVLTHLGKSLFVQDDLPDWWERICNGAVCYCNNRYLEIIINSKRSDNIAKLFRDGCNGVGVRRGGMSLLCLLLFFFSV